MMPSFGLAIVMGLWSMRWMASTWRFGKCWHSRSVVGMIVYLGLARLLRVESYTYLREALVEMSALSRNANA